MTRLLEKYKDEIVPALKERFNITNDLGCPRIEKIVVNMGVGRAVQEPRAIELASDELARITGQKPLVTKARKSVSGFKLRKAMPIGLKVTLRGRRMYEFLDRLISIAMPRIRDLPGAIRPDDIPRSRRRQGRVRPGDGRVHRHQELRPGEVVRDAGAIRDAFQEEMTHAWPRKPSSKSATDPRSTRRGATTAVAFAGGPAAITASSVSVASAFAGWRTTE